MAGGETGAPGWRFVHLGLIVTGEGERTILPKLLRALTADRTCTFQVLGRTGQRKPRGERRELAMVRSGKTIPDKDATEIGLPARQWLAGQPDRFLLLVDDLEWERRESIQGVFDRYRIALDAMLQEPDRPRAAVHFLVMMLEAYYFADAQALNGVLGLQLADYARDVEAIRHPKADLRDLIPGFDEVRDGLRVAERLDLRHVLSRPDTCASLRTLVAWCVRAKGGTTDEFCLADGAMNPVTAPQLKLLDQPA
jgi:hypothetical protein